jgi:superfamily II DNA or RNA helicase
MSGSVSAIDGLLLRDWQKIAINNWLDNSCRGIAEVATAGGKTRFALECAKLFILKNPRGKVVVYVPTTALQDQWAVTISETFKIPLGEISTWSDSIKMESTFQVIVINTAREKVEELNKQNWDLILIADECHRYASEENSKALSLQSKASIGISATAEREYDDGLKEILIPSLGPIIFEYSLLQASTDEVISPFEIYNVEIEMTEDEKQNYDTLSRRIGIALRQNDMEKVQQLSIIRSRVSKKAILRIPVACAIAEREYPRKTIIFHEDIESAEEIFQLLLAKNFKALLYHSKMSPQMRRYNLKMFRSGKIDTLVCIRALDEGVDIPEAEVAIIASSTTSKRQRVQRIGRVVRKHEGKLLARIYSVYATESERDLLLQESNTFAGMAKVQWLRMERSE